MPNTFAYLVLYSYPIVVVLIFKALPRAQALVWSILSGYLILPFGIGINLPLLPAFTKDLLPVVTAAAFCLLVPEAPPAMRRTASASLRGAAGRAPAPMSTRPSFTRQSAPRPVRSAPDPDHPAPLTGAGLRRNTWVVNGLLVLLVTTPFLTVLQNAEPVAVGPRILNGLKTYDGFSMALDALVSVLPFLLARRYLAGPDRHEMLLRILCLAALIYTLPALFEIRMSPQLNRWVYGYFPSSFAQQMRDGGFRPVVFLQHGLRLALFFAMASLATFALFRVEKRSERRAPVLLAGLWLVLVLVLCKTFGALASVLILGPVVLLATVRAQMLMAAAVAAAVLTYPVLRGADLVPVDSIVSVAATLDKHRAQSLEFRLKNEDILLERAREKPLAGWGGWGRNRVYDPKTGRDLSVTDGAWIIVIGISGWLGYIARFGLLAAPLLLLALRSRRLGLTLASSGLCLVHAANLIDLIPNSGLTPITWMVAGALMGRWESGPAGAPDPAPSGRPGRRSGEGRRPGPARPMARRIRQ